MLVTKMITAVAVSLGLAGGVVMTQATQAQAATTAPKALRGTYYNYQGHHQWAKLVIGTHQASLKNSFEHRTFRLTTRAKSLAHRFVYQKTDGYFTLNAKLRVMADSPFPEGGMRLTTRRIKGKTYRVIRGYQSGYHYDYIKGHRFAHSYTGRA